MDREVGSAVGAARSLGNDGDAWRIISIMECIHFQVPMVIIPGLRDQPGNMARAVHHGSRYLAI